ncbi:hypothetical protein [Nodosilinea nodulosa]|uniref:hypothetical protein n=1 Tax=Nodosilinea nodulosa TaxID=416001 RepID=UPI0012D84C54|nr:hypothetical protein [Nodosilinea nodulosa]
MTRSYGPIKMFKLSVKALGQESGPEATNIGIRLLHNSLRELRSLEQAKFTLLPPFGGSHMEVTQDFDLEEVLYSGLQIEAPLDGFRLILRSLKNWLGRVSQRFLFTLELSQSFLITLQTNQIEPLVQLLILGEYLLPAHDTYLNKAEAYIDSFGELTPCIKANLNLIGYRMKISDVEAKNLNTRVMEPLKDLEEKYSNFRQELLLVSDEESLLDDKFWNSMKQRASVIRLPEVDFDFLMAERQKELREEYESNKRKIADELDLYRKKQENLTRYCKAFEDLILDFIKNDAFDDDPLAMCQEIIDEIELREFGRGRLSEIRSFYKDIPVELNLLEKRVISEICLLLSFF